MKKFKWILVPLFDEESKRKFEKYIYDKVGKKIRVGKQYRDGLVLQLVSTDLKEFDLINITCLNDYPAYRTDNVDKFIDWYENVYSIFGNVEIIKHIPHASLELPENQSMVFKGNFNLYNLKMSDVGIDLIFKDVPGIEYKAPYSRLYCDVERYKDNKKEEMSKYGQGYIYDKLYDGKTIFRFNIVNGHDVYKEIEDYYDNYHQGLTDLVNSKLKEGHDVLILDLHSYSDELAVHIDKKPPFPDICIGINEDFDNKKMLDYIINKIKEKGYSYQINYPYSGSIVPRNIIKGKGKVYSIMLEVNKRIYL